MSDNMIELGIGPMSVEIVEAVFRYSNFHRKPLMLIPSKNQVDHAGGYVNNWTTALFMQDIKAWREKYPQAFVKVCRDHCGPGFNGSHDLTDVYASIEADVSAGFDLIHIDFCHFKGSREERFEASKKAVLRCLELNPNIEIEIGTDENEGINFSLATLRELEEEVDFFLSFCKPRFYVVQTGSLVMETGQVGSFNPEFVNKVYDLISSKGLRLKEHNADYLTASQIGLRKGIVHGMNIAPQFGVIQTQIVLSKCSMYGIDTSLFIEDVYNSGKWKKWLKDSSPENKMLCVLIAGHYRFGKEPYKKIMQQLEEVDPEIHEHIISEMMNVIDHYVKSTS